LILKPSPADLVASVSFLVRVWSFDGYNWHVVILLPESRATEQRYSVSGASGLNAG